MQLRRPRRPDRALAVAGAAPARRTPRWGWTGPTTPSGCRAAGWPASSRAGPDDWRGLSLTMPLKREAVPLLTSHDEWAGRSPARRTPCCSSRTASGTGSTPTCPARSRRCASEHDGPVERAVVLGGGATATSVLLALAERGCAGPRSPSATRRAPPRRCARWRAHPAAPRGGRRSSWPSVDRAVGRRGRLDHPGRGPGRPGWSRAVRRRRRSSSTSSTTPWPTPLAAAAARPAGPSSAGSTCSWGRRWTRCAR